MNTNWTKQTHYAALDWASDHHDVIVVDHSGAVVAEFRFAHTAEGWAKFSDKMKPYAGCPVALETSSGPAVDQLLQRGARLLSDPVADFATVHRGEPVEFPANAHAAAP